MDEDEARAIVELTVSLSRAAMLASYTPQSCVAAVRLVGDVLDHFGIDTRPQVVEAVAFNQRYVDRIAAGDPLEEIVNDPAVQAIGIGIADDNVRARFDSSRGQNPMHLVLVQERYLIDPSLDQVRYARAPMRIGPCAFRWTPEEHAAFGRGEPVYFALVDDDGQRVGVRYEPRLRNHDYTRYRDWQADRRRTLGNIAGQVIRDLRGAV